MRAHARHPASAESDTVVIAGGGFTGVETAAEFPARPGGVPGPDAAMRAVMAERDDAMRRRRRPLGPVRSK